MTWSSCFNFQSFLPKCFLLGFFLGYYCKVEFNQPSCWFYSMPNLLVFQQLITLYLGGIFVRVVSEIV